MPDPSIQRFRRVVEVALRHLESRREEINDLNVFPVADGDTGDNMARTMEAVRQALDRLERDAGEDAPREQIVSTVAEAALLGARGNSGVITSQIVRGAAEVLATPTGRLVDPELIVESLQSAARAARGSVAKPAEGTILTAADEMAAAAAERLAGHQALGEDVSDEEQNGLLAEMLTVVLEAGEEAVRRSPEQLQVLAEAETVDAGAYALVVLVRGMIAGLLGNDDGLPPLPHYPAARIDASAHADSRFDHCLNLIVRRNDEALVPELPDGVAELGDSIEVVGDAAMLRVHIHTDTPDDVVQLLAPLGEVHVDSCDYMPDQIAARAARAQTASAGAGAALIAVADGAGFEQLFAEMGVSVVPGGPKLNPSTEEILAAIEAAPALEAVVLPNSPNVVLAAEEAARSSDKRVFVAGCHSPQAAAEILVTLNRERSAEEMAEEIADQLDDVRTAVVAEAAREDGDGRFAVGDSIGLIGDEVICWGSPAEALSGVVEAIGDSAEVLTVFCGATAPLSRGEVEALLPDSLEAQVLDGGQRTHWWLVSAQ
ncbi:MAG TPA: DAK2 domain-containing protein [Solirubrobacterales bacterium]|nr:DAK2 domain-containing protein [Solirubrobacterales bacterium]